MNDKIKINAKAFTGPFMSQFNGMDGTLTGTKGASGETTAVLLTVGQLYLRADQYTAKPAT